MTIVVLFLSSSAKLINPLLLKFDLKDRLKAVKLNIIPIKDLYCIEDTKFRDDFHLLDT